VCVFRCYFVNPEYLLVMVIKTGVWLDEPSYISGVAGLILESNVLLHADWNTVLFAKIVSNRLLLGFLIFNSPRVRPASPFVCSGYQALAPEQLPPR
jgi:hypothetical protein